MSQQQIIEIVAKAMRSASTNMPFSWENAATFALSALREAGFVIAPIKLLSEAHACMWETGWHDAHLHQRSDDGVIEAAVSDIERRFAEVADFRAARDSIKAEG